MFFSQFTRELYQIADRTPNRSLPHPVHIILDDMGANLQIPNLDCLISTSRGRDISFSIILQSFGQLKKNYIDYTSIISSCNNLVFLGSNDIETCQDIAIRLNKPLNEVLYKEQGTIFVFQQGAKKPFTTKIYDLTKHPLYNELSAPYTTPETTKRTIEKGEVENYDEI
jgi:type IV secretion system protein VirD4